MKVRSRKILMSYFTLLVLLTTGTTCGPKLSQIKNSPARADVQTRGTGIREQWEARVKELNLAEVGKDYPAKRLEILQPLLANAPAEETRAEFERIRSSPTDVQNMSEYDRTLLQAFVETAVMNGDRDKLVQLLSFKCPPFIATDPIELYLADSGMPTPLLVLFDSYEATTDRSKRFILEVLKRVFRSVVHEENSEEKFLAASRDWYLRVGSKLKINSHYHPAALDDDDRELFVK